MVVEGWEPGGVVLGAGRGGVGSVVLVMMEVVVVAVVVVVGSQLGTPCCVGWSVGDRGAIKIE